MGQPIAFMDSEWDFAERRLVAHHLRSGKQAMSWMGYSWCRFDCGVAAAEILHHVRHEAEHPSRKYQLVEDNQAADYALWVAWSNEHANQAPGFRELGEFQRKPVLQRRLAEVPRPEDESALGRRSAAGVGEGAEL
jgi:hypothetical protein